MSDYSDQLVDILSVDERIVGKFRILSYLPDLQFEKTTKIKELDTVVEVVAETFDTFKVLDLVNNKECYIYYGDHDSFGVCGLKTLIDKCKPCISRS